MNDHENANKYKLKELLVSTVLGFIAHVEVKDIILNWTVSESLNHYPLIILIIVSRVMLCISGLTM